jgi:hypothetical protein
VEEQTFQDFGSPDDESYPYSRIGRVAKVSEYHSNSQEKGKT